MPSGFRITTMLLALGLAPTGLAPGAAAARCQTGPASAPFIGAADMRAIDKASARLPRARKGSVDLSVGAPLPARVERAPLPKAVAKVLPQYRGYAAFRIGGQLAIADPRGVLSYLMPLGRATKPGNCP